MKVNLTGLAKRLVHDKLASQAEAIQAINSSSTQQGNFVAHLLSNKNISDWSIAQSAAAEFALPLLDLDSFDKTLRPQNIISQELISKHQVLPLFQTSHRLILATSDPSDLRALQEINFVTGLRSEYVVVSHSQLQSSVREYTSHYDSGFSNSFEPLAQEPTDQDILIVETQNRTKEKSSKNDKPIVQFVNRLFLDAIRDRASDIHVELYENLYRVRFRIDGVLHIAKQPPLNIANRVVSRIKVLAKLDISEKRLPQDGHIKVKVSSRRSVHFRVNCLPTSWGEKIVLRLLNPQATNVGIDALGYDEWQKEQFLKAISQRQGLVLLTGPTGSGKSTSLYSALSFLNSPEKNIVSIEDPIEIGMDGINQISVNSRIGLSFASALRAVLRQDPDIIMIGEIRDSETAEIAIKAAQTGHLVLATLHTNNAIEALTRLGFMKIPGYNLATAVHLIIAQRLARKLCEYCKESVELPEKVFIDEEFKAHEIKSLRTYRAVGCDRCRDGFRGRLGIYEVVPITTDLSRSIMAGGNALELAEQQRKMGFHNLRKAALIKVTQGLTSLEEANRVT